MAEPAAVTDIETAPVGRIQGLTKHKEFVAEWAKFMVSSGYEVQVTQVSEGLMEGIAW